MSPQESEQRIAELQDHCKGFVELVATAENSLEHLRRTVDAFLHACGHGSNGPWSDDDRKELLAAIHRSLADWIYKFSEEKKEKDALQSRLTKALKTIDELNEAAIESPDFP